MSPTRYHCTISKPELGSKKTSVYKWSTQIIICLSTEWSGSGVEQNSGVSQLFYLSKIDRVGF